MAGLVYCRSYGTHYGASNREGGVRPTLGGPSLADGFVRLKSPELQPEIKGSGAAKLGLPDLV
jgi:hypothetical protein